MNKAFVVGTIAALIASSLPPGEASDASAVSKAIVAAMGDSARPATDTVRDADRKPVKTLEFAGVKPGDKVADYAAGSGYFTRLFADVVGPDGHVYAVVPSALFQYPNIVKGIADVQTFAVKHANVTVTFASALDGVRFPEKLDLFWIAQNYHDLKDPFMGPVNMAVFNKAVYQALKPGGLYVVLDHSADRKSTRLNSSHPSKSRMPSSA
jgi:predicted methyltransferase